MDFESLTIGNQYDRPHLARLWGYKSHKALGRGVFTPKGQNTIVLFVTEEKQSFLPQYEDHIEQDILYWEGEEKHGADRRIIERRDQVYVFFRRRHHMLFTFEGRAVLEAYQLNTSRPSKFAFRLIDRAVSELDIVQDISASYGLTATEKEAIIRSRRGQGIYRSNSLQLWKTCSVTGFTKKNVLIASHIKPWKLSSNPERIDAFNSLLLLPTLDKLFDKGYIGFEPSGKIAISSHISRADLDRVGVSTQTRLRQVPEETQAYLGYHMEYRFDMLRG